MVPTTGIETTQYKIDHATAKGLVCCLCLSYRLHPSIAGGVMVTPLEQAPKGMGWKRGGGWVRLKSKIAYMVK